MVVSTAMSVIFTQSIEGDILPFEWVLVVCCENRSSTMGPKWEDLHNMTVALY